VVCAGNMRYGVPELSMRDINAPITIELVSKAFPEAVRAAGADVLLVQEVGRMQMPAVARASGLMHMAFGPMFDPFLERRSENHLGVGVFAKWPVQEVRRVAYGLFDVLFPDNWQGANRGRAQRCELLLAKIGVPWHPEPVWFSTTHFMMSRQLQCEPNHLATMENLVEATFGHQPLLHSMDANQDMGGDAWELLVREGRFESYVPPDLQTTFDPTSPGVKKGLVAVIDWLLGRGLPRPYVEQVFGVSDHSMYVAHFPA